MKVRIDKSEGLNVLIVEPQVDDEGHPVLLFLHGMGEAGESINGVPLVMVHHTPPFQAILGRLRDVTVVAPQAPHAPDSGWNWSTHVEALCRYLAARFSERPILATGFSRGALGVLQLLQTCPQLISRWAVVDPQPGSDVWPYRVPDPDGWLTYGPQIAMIQAFSEQLAQRLESKNVRPTNYNHAELALKAYEGDRLGGAENIYDFLGLKYVPNDVKHGSELS
ncbi:MAG TPA: alpha/beta hydrolase [Anaerolineae bacterium]